MAANLNLAAVDLGAGSGRVILGRFDGEALALEEINRFVNAPVYAGGALYWDILYLYREIKNGLRRAGKGANGCIAGIGIDSWGNDFGLLDRKGCLIGNPVHYRDDRTKGMMEKVFEIVSKESVFKQTGIQFMRLNGIYQLFSMTQTRQPILDAADKLLLIPDLITYFLTGIGLSEYTVATTTQMIDPSKADWARELLGKLGIPLGLFTEIVKPRAIIGRITDKDCMEYDLKNAMVTAVAEHDTGSAVIAVPAENEDFVYISSGTWSLMGVEVKRPVINDKTYEYNFTNEGGAFATFRLLKNVMGLWMMQECRRYWENRGEDCTYAALDKAAQESEPFKCFIDPDDNRFVEPDNMPFKIESFCRETGQKPPETKGEYVRCIRESLALKYRYVLEEIEEITGKNYPVLHIVGGGSLDAMLCSFTANSTGRKAIAGPVEATAIGNIMVQAAALGEIGGLRETRQIVRHSFNFTEYLPNEQERWNDAYVMFSRVLCDHRSSQ